MSLSSTSEDDSNSDSDSSALSDQFVLSLLEKQFKKDGALKKKIGDAQPGWILVSESRVTCPVCARAQVKPASSFSSMLPRMLNVARAGHDCVSEFKFLRRPGPLNVWKH